MVTTGDDDQLLSVVNEEVYDGFIGDDLNGQHLLGDGYSEILYLGN